MIRNIVPGIPFILDAHTHVKVQFYLEEGATVRFDVRAGSTIDVYLVDKEQFDRFVGDNDWEYEEGESQCSIYQETIEIPYSDNWTLLIDNGSDEKIPTYFDIRVWTRPWWISWLF